MAHTLTIESPAQHGANSIVAVWDELASAEEGTILECLGYADRCVQVEGTWSGATMSFKGSNNKVNFVSLTDPQGNAIELTDDGIEQVMEYTRYVRAETSGGGAGTDLNVTLVAKKNTRS